MKWAWTYIFSFHDRIWSAKSFYLKWFNKVMFFFHHSLSLFTWQKRGSWIGPQLSTTMALLLSTIGKKFLANTNKLSIRKAQAGVLQHRIAHYSLCGSSLVNVIWLRTPTDGRDQEKSMIFQSSPRTRLGWNGLTSYW